MSKQEKEPTTRESLEIGIDIQLVQAIENLAVRAMQEAPVSSVRLARAALTLAQTYECLFSKR